MIDKSVTICKSDQNQNVILYLDKPDSIVIDVVNKKPLQLQPIQIPTLMSNIFSSHKYAAFTNFEFISIILRKISSPEKESHFLSRQRSKSEKILSKLEPQTNSSTRKNNSFQKPKMPSKLLLAFKYISKMKRNTLNLKKNIPIKNQTTLQHNLRKNDPTNSYLNVPSIKTPNKIPDSSLSLQSKSFKQKTSDFRQKNEQVIFEGIQIIFSVEGSQKEITEQKQTFQTKEKTYIEMLKQIIKKYDQNHEVTESLDLSDDEIANLAFDPYILRNIHNQDFGRFCIR